MKKLTPVQQAKYVEKEYRKYIKSTFTLIDDEYNQMFIDELKDAEIVKGPYLNKMLPFKSGLEIQELIDNNVLHKDFSKILDTKLLSRRLYLHQIEAINKINNGRNIVVTTGTGSGKTESYLYPILNKIMNDPDIDKPGVRALFLFPMNALVNDQMSRVRKLLSNYPKIKYGRYVGDSKDNVDPKYERKRLGDIFSDDNNKVTIPENELVTREEIRKFPPHILFTNYSMLEYLLLRPKDSELFSEKYTDSFNFIVLDEAHTYAGAMGIEVSMLLRRLCQKMNKTPQFILTSATLGQQGESENDIIQFANNLTSGHFETTDIIFSERKRLTDQGTYRLESEDYIYIKENLEDINKIKIYLSKYKQVNASSVSELLLEMFKYDENVLDLDEYLQQPELFSNIKNVMPTLTEEGLIALIYLVSYVFSNSFELFDIKYHTFIRTIDGCFITLGDEKKLTLKRQKELEGRILFEIGKCKKCGEIYLVGKIDNNKLIQNTDLDIFENTEESSEVYYFILDGEKNDLDDEDVEEYQLCTVCGEIHAVGETNVKWCTCPDNERITVYRAKRDKSKHKKESNILYNNNITYCPCCGRSSNNGIVSTFYLGKDGATAILTQLLLEAIDDLDLDRSVVKVDDNPFATAFGFSVEETKEEYVKQLLQFSDARQQASFAAIFSEYSHERFLRKRLLIEELKNSVGPINISVLVSKLEQRIHDGYLFDNAYSIQSNGDFKNAWITILKDLLNIDGSFSAESLGLYAFIPDLKEIENSFSYINNYLKQQFGINYSFTLEEFITIVSIIILEFRNVPAINYIDSTLTFDEKKDEFSYRMFDNYVAYSIAKGQVIYDANGEDISHRVKSLLPKNNKLNKILNYIMATLNVDVTHAKSIIHGCIKVCETLKIFEVKDTILYKIRADRFSLHNGKDIDWYLCSKCKMLTHYNLNSVCPNCASKSLESCDPSSYYLDNYYRHEYSNKKIERLTFSEHTGQLETSNATKILSKFKSKKINVLSCSTTFEMGVDIGSLETVFMRNVPPTPANYVQRAGRAGRGEDSSAFVLTFCGNNSHDYTYYQDPKKMIAGIINPPLFKVSNKKIVLRHITDTALSFYLKNHSSDFDKIGNFMSNYSFFTSYVNASPSDLNDFINGFIAHTGLTEYMNFGWKDEVIGHDGTLERYYQDFNAEITELENLATQAFQAGETEKGGYYKAEIKKKQEQMFIDALANSNVIPRYGFPVNTVSLITENDNDKIDLSRDLQIALSEYAPESEVLANKKKYTSRYVVVPKGVGLTKNYYYSCRSCERINYGFDPSTICQCDACNTLNDPSESFFVVPIKGFKADTRKSTSKNVKPKKTYANDICYIGNGTYETHTSYKNRMDIISSVDEELMVLNESAFYMCQKCGYTIISNDDDIVGKRIINKNHGPKSNECNSPLERTSLGYTFKTDIIKLKMGKFFSLEQSLSFVYALLDGISKVCTIERKDINGLCVKEPDSSFSIVIYDDVPGGAGHVKQLINLNLFERILKETYNKIKDCTCALDTSCYNCLRNYKNQRIHKKLTRSNAIDILTFLLK